MRESEQLSFLHICQNEALYLVEQDLPLFEWLIFTGSRTCTTKEEGKQLRITRKDRVSRSGTFLSCKTSSHHRYSEALDLSPRGDEVWFLKRRKWPWWRRKLWRKEEGATEFPEKTKG
ncbi:hypothetical protein HAX54_037057 [Datura stramonium]|uniref:Uncharacterized protein n=1 Tax=Datura stramonium TaxID=4076 RepID=A0ABS8VLS5_DATST|nr:hypothetical protein [Datura stramonium]